MSMITPEDLDAGPPQGALKPQDFKGKVEPDWCAGCGDFGVLKGLQKACGRVGTAAP